MTPLEVRVRRRLSAIHPDVGEMTVLPGGHSGLTYRVTAGDERYVIKAVPEGQTPVGRNDVLRQARALSALSSCADVPVPIVVAADPEVPAWFAMTFASGEANEPVLDGGIDPGLARRRMLRAAEVLRCLHDAGSVGLRDDPATPETELGRWSRTMHAVPADLRPGSDRLLALLERSVPSGENPAVVHGDFRLGNLLFEADTATAIVDWEIWGVGDPRVDLGWFLVFNDHRLFPDIGHDVPGLPNDDELLAAYAGGGERPKDLPWFFALGRMKMAAIMGHNLKRHREGRHHDPAQEDLPPSIAALIASATSILAD